MIYNEIQPWMLWTAGIVGYFLMMLVTMYVMGMAGNDEKLTGDDIGSLLTMALFWPIILPLFMMGFCYEMGQKHGKKFEDGKKGQERITD